MESTEGGMLRFYSILQDSFKEKKGTVEREQETAEHYEPESSVTDKQSTGERRVGTRGFSFGLFLWFRVSVVFLYEPETSVTDKQSTGERRVETR